METSDLDEGADWGKGVPMTPGKPTVYEYVDESSEPTVDVVVVDQPKYKTSRAGNMMVFMGEYEHRGSVAIAEMTIWDENLDRVSQTLSQGDVITGVLKNYKTYKNKHQWTLVPSEPQDDKRHPTHPEAGEDGGCEERPPPPTRQEPEPQNLGEAYQTRYQTAPISWRTPVNYQQMSKIVARSFSDAYSAISGVVEADMIRKGIPIEKFPLEAVVGAAQSAGATISIACTNGVVEISRERSVRRQDRQPPLEAREIATQAKELSERIKKELLGQQE